MRRAGSFALGVFVVGRLYLFRGIDAAAGGLIASILIGSMIWRSDVWAEYVLPFGFWASKASDFERASHSAAGIAIMGWALMLLFAAAVYLLPAASMP